MGKFLFIAGLVTAAALMSGCSPRITERIVERTDTLTVVDTVIIRERPDTVRVEVPVSSQEVSVKDTASHLEDNLYYSDAYWDGLFLHHSLKSKPGASLTQTVIVHDTLRVKEKSEKSNTSSSEKKTVYVQPTVKDKLAYSFYGVVASIVLLIIAYAIKKRF